MTTEPPRQLEKGPGLTDGASQDHVKSVPRWYTGYGKKVITKIK